MVALPTVVKRQDAIAQGLKWYFTSKPCKRGHVSERRSNSRECKTCAENDSKEYYWNNREKALSNNAVWHRENLESRASYDARRRASIGDRLRSQSLSWNRNNPERVRESNKRYLENNRERIVEFRRVYNSIYGRAKRQAKYAANRELMRARWKAWYHANKAYNAARAQSYRARLAGAEGHHTGDQIKMLHANQKFLCASCCKSIRKKFHIDHVMPLVLGGSNWISNIQLLCPHCNLSKGRMHPIDWARENGRLL